MTTNFQVPLRFSPRTSDPASTDEEIIPLDYTTRPVGMKQPRLDGRLVLTPEIDLSRYTCRAVIDWVWLEFETQAPKPTQSIALSNYLERVLGRRHKVTGPGVPHDANPTNVTETLFRLKIQDPTPWEIHWLEHALKSYRGLAGPIRVIGIEIALDWYARDHSDQARWEMVAALQRHHLPHARGLVLPYADLHQTYPRVNPKAGDEDETDTEFVIHDNRWIVAGKAGPGRLLSDLDFVEEERVRQRILRVKAHHAPFIDSTLYRGVKYGPAMFRVQNKVTDKNNPKAGTVKMLGPDERRARVEVTLLGGEVERAGFGEVGDLIGFSFGALRKPYFPFWLPAVAGGIKRDGSDPSLREQRLGRLLQAVFAKSGIYGANLYEAASEIEKSERHKIRRTIGEGMKPAPRIRAGEWGHLLAWGKMTQRTRRAFDLLSERWSWAALKKMLPPETTDKAA